MQDFGWLRGTPILLASQPRTLCLTAASEPISQTLDISMRLPILLSILKQTLLAFGAVSRSGPMDCADAFGPMAIAYEEPSRLASFNRKLEYADPASFV